MEIPASDPIRIPAQKFLRRGHKERYTADDQDRDKGSLPSDSGEDSYRRNSWGRIPAIVRSAILFGFNPHSKHPGFSEKLEKISFPAVFQISGGNNSLTVMGTIQGGCGPFTGVFQSQSQGFSTALRLRSRSFVTFSTLSA